MFARISFVFVTALLAMVMFATASPLKNTETPVSQCNTGPIQCCNSVKDSHDSSVAPLLTLLGVGPVRGLVGFNCSPIVGGNSCTQQPVCCTNNSFNGLINIGCSPINVNL